MWQKVFIGSLYCMKRKSCATRLLNTFPHLWCLTGVPPRAHSRDSSDSVDGRATPTENAIPPPRIEKPPVLPFFNRPPSALPLMGLPPPPIPPPPPLSSSFGVPPPPPGIHYQHLMPPPPRLPPHLSVPPPGSVPPALHLNPAFFPPPNAAMGPPPDAYSKASAPYNHSRWERVRA